jgi:hypothetical protein
MHCQGQGQKKHEPGGEVESATTTKSNRVVSVQTHMRRANLGNMFAPLLASVWINQLHAQTHSPIANAKIGKVFHAALPIYLIKPRSLGRCHRIVKIELSQSFVQNYPDRGGEVERANSFVGHRDSQTSIPVRDQQILGQAARFSSEDQAVVRLISPISVDAFGFCREVEKAAIRQGVIESFDVAVVMNLDIVPVIESSAADGFSVGAEAEFSDQVQRREGRAAEAGDVAGIRRDFRLDQRDA